MKFNMKYIKLILYLFTISINVNGQDTNNIKNTFGIGLNCHIDHFKYFPSKTKTIVSSRPPLIDLTMTLNKANKYIFETSLGLNMKLPKNNGIAFSQQLFESVMYSINRNNYKLLAGIEIGYIFSFQKSEIGNTGEIYRFNSTYLYIGPILGCEYFIKSNLSIGLKSGLFIEHCTSSSYILKGDLGLKYYLK